MPLLCCRCSESAHWKVCEGTGSSPVKWSEMNLIHVSFFSSVSLSLVLLSPPSPYHLPCCPLYHLPLTPFCSPVICPGVCRAVICVGASLVLPIICHGVPTVLSSVRMSPLFLLSFVLSILSSVLVSPLVYNLSWFPICSLYHLSWCPLCSLYDLSWCPLCFHMSWYPFYSFSSFVLMFLLLPSWYLNFFFSITSPCVLVCF